MMPVIDLWEQKNYYQQQQVQTQQHLPEHSSPQQQTQQHRSYHHQQPVSPERRYVLSNPPTFTRTRNSSVDSASSLITGGHEMKILSRRSDSFVHLDSLQETPVSVDNQGGPISKYEMLLRQIAAQRAKLNALNVGAQTLTKDIETLNNTLGEEQDSREAVLQDASRAVHGWEQTWTAYSKCEPVQALQERPNDLVSLIQGMTWEDKKGLFEQLVASCRPRETYQLQYQLSTQHGHVVGFDLLEEFSSDIATLILKKLAFSDLASCRMVSRAWKQKVMVYDVLASALDCLTFADDIVDMDKQDDMRKNWNQLCRYQERSVRWKRHKPASAHLMTGHTSYVTSIKDRGEWIISGGYDEKVRLWEAATGRCVKIWEVDSAVSCVELLVDATMEGGGVVVAAFVDVGLVKVWSLHGPLNMYTLTGHQKGVRALAINENYLVTAGFDQTVLVWNWSTGRKVASFRAHNEVILGVHLLKNTVYTFCIDATLRVFDIPSKTLLHQVKLFDVQQGSSLQWSYLQDKIFLAATNRKIYVWQMEHLEGLVQQQQQQHQQQILRYRSPSAISLASSSDMGSELQQLTPPISPSRTPLGLTPSSSLTNLVLQPDIPAPSTLSTFNSVSSGSTCFSSAIDRFSVSVETRVKPCLTAVLTLTSDMWCGNVTHHDPPLLLIGSRSSPVKLSAVTLTRDIIDPSKVYSNDYVPFQATPKCLPFQGMPTGHGQGAMCIDSSSGRLVVGCTGGSIHVLNMDPAKRNMISLRSNASATVVTLPHLTPTQMDSIRSVVPANPLSQISMVSPGLGSSRATTTVIATNNVGYPRKTGTVFRSNNSSSTIYRPGTIMLPSPDRSLPISVANSMLISPATHLSRGSPPRRGTMCKSKSVTPQSEYEEQEVLVDSYDGDISLEFSDGDISNVSLLDITSKPKERSSDSKDRLKPLMISGKSGSKPSLSTSPTSPTPRTGGGQKSGALKVSSSNTTPSTPTPSSSSYTSQTFSSLSKFIPSTSSKIMMRRRSSSTAWTQQITSTAITTVSKTTPGDGCVSGTSPPRHSVSIPSAVTVLMKGRNRSDPNLLGSDHHDSSTSTSTINTSAIISRSLVKSWSLPSPWNTPSRIGSKK
ncbi:hypothetical protein FBU30_009409 [Linnemannia zychae]|nr:hypothetical protein FBU30_009409 [Linnemannia zychae]